MSNDVKKIGWGWLCPIGRYPVMKGKASGKSALRWPESIPIWRRQRKKVDRSFLYAFVRTFIERIS